MFTCSVFLTRSGARRCAWISLHDDADLTEEALREFCHDRISRQKVPQHIRFVTSLPMTGSGKVQKFLMLNQMAEDLGHLIIV